MKVLVLRVWGWGEDQGSYTTTWEELWLSRENSQQRTADIHTLDAGDEGSTRWTADLVSLYMGVQTLPTLAAPSAFLARVTFLRVSGKSCPFVLGKMFLLSSRANFTAGTFTSMRKILIGWSSCMQCEIKLLLWNSSLIEDLNHR